MFHFLNPNPNGNLTGDCVIRALSIAQEKSWDDTFLTLMAYSYDMKDMPSSNNVWNYYLHNNGYKRNVIPDICPNCINIKDFVQNTNGEYILGTGTHVVAVKDGIYYDTWDSGNEIPIYYWKKG
jgi:hypothetical protein